MKKVLVEGYSKNNLGDDLFFKILLKRYPDTMFFFTGADNAKILTQFKNAKIIHVRFLKILRLLPKFDAYVLIGGSLFQESSSLKIWIKHWLLLFIKIVVCRVLRVRVNIIGFNFGPYRTKLYLRLYKLLFKYVNFLSVRDEKTKNLFEKNVEINYFPDIVFGLPFKKIDKADRCLAISVMDFGKLVSFQTEYEDFLVNVINRINKDVTINLFGFQHSSEIDDGEVIKRIKARIPRHDINEYLYTGSNLNDFLGRYRQNNVALTSRFHSLVLSLKVEQNIVAINYNIKVENLINTLELGFPLISINEFGNEKVFINVANKLNYMLERKNINSKENIKLEKVAKLSNGHFKDLDNFLNS